MSRLTFDLNTWLQRLPLSRVSPAARSGQPICSPWHICVIEQLRMCAGVSTGREASAPTDVFIFASGESPERDVTKIGGLPYRPRDLKWPAQPDGKPCTFLAQFRFTESDDLVGQMPGDMLLVFCCDENLSDDNQGLLFEWYPLGLQDLVDSATLPPPAWNFVTCYGYRYRTLDYYDRALIRRLQSVIPEEANHAFAASSLWRLEGTKIGGLPMFLDEAREYELSKKRFLCQLSSISPTLCEPYPWVNRDLPIDLRESGPQNLLLFRDGFSIYFFLDADKRISWTLDFN